MSIILCLEFEGVDCNGARADEIVDIITADCKQMQIDFGASDCYVMDADDE